MYSDEKSDVKIQAKAYKVKQQLRIHFIGLIYISSDLK